MLFLCHLSPYLTYSVTSTPPIVLLTLGRGGGVEMLVDAPESLHVSMLHREALSYSSLHGSFKVNEVKVIVGLCRC